VFCRTQPDIEIEVFHIFLSSIYWFTTLLEYITSFTITEGLIRANTWLDCLFQIESLAVFVLKLIVDVQYVILDELKVNIAEFVHEVKFTHTILAVVQDNTKSELSKLVFVISSLKLRYNLSIESNLAKDIIGHILSVELEYHASINTKFQSESFRDEFEIIFESSNMEVFIVSFSSTFTLI
jgi:hypothetical protein